MIEIVIPNKFVYVIDRVIYEQKMAINQMRFMLEYHANDSTDDFLTSDLFKRLHKKLVTAAAQKWCTETVIIKEITGKTPNSYYIDIENAKAMVEI